MKEQLEKALWERVKSTYPSGTSKHTNALLEEDFNDFIEQVVKLCTIPCVITPLLTDKEIEEYIWEEIPISLSQIDIDTHSDGYIRYLNAVHWAKWGRDNCNGL